MGLINPTISHLLQLELAYLWALTRPIRTTKVATVCTGDKVATVRIHLVPP